MGWLGWLRKEKKAEVHPTLCKQVKVFNLTFNLFTFMYLIVIQNIIQQVEVNLYCSFSRWFETGAPRWILHPAEVTSRHLQLFCNHQCHCWQPPDRWLAACSGYLRRDAAKHLGVTATMAPPLCFLNIRGMWLPQAHENCPILPTWQVLTSPIMVCFGTSNICLGFVNRHSFHCNNEVK